MDQIFGGSENCSKLGAQITNESPKSGCAKSAISLTEAQKMGVQMRPFANNKKACICAQGPKPFDLFFLCLI